MFKRSRVLTFLVALVLSVGAALFAASPAYAGCQSTPLSLALSNGSLYTYYCSGNQYPYSYVDAVATGPWGGYINYEVSGNIYTAYFCDNQSFWVGGYLVSKVYMAASRPWWC
jgi:hypothetical protein